MSDIAASGDRSISAATISGVATSGDNQTIYVTQNYSGLSRDEARELALEVFKNNYLKVSDDAWEIARKRVEELLDRFLEKLQREAPEALANVAEPGVQRAIFRAQQEAACSNDKDLGELLVDMLAKRVAERDRSLRQIVLDEALATAPKLTQPQLSALSIAFVLRQTRQIGLAYSQAVPALMSCMSNYLDPLVDAASDYVDLQHLSYTGCLTISFGHSSAGALIRTKYPGLFCDPIMPNEVADALLPAFEQDPAGKGLFIPAVDEEAVSVYLQDRGLAEHQPQIVSLLQSHQQSDDLAVERISLPGSSVRKVLDLWNSTVLGQALLTSVGIALGYANLVRHKKFDADLRIWFPH